MGYRIERNNIDLKKSRIKKIAPGISGDIYLYKNNALKVFKDNQPARMTKETAEYLKGIRTNRILLPKKLLFYNDTFKGYTLKLVKDKKTKGLASIPTSELISNVQELEDDINNISNRKVLLTGISPENTIYNGSLYLTDPSEYQILEIIDTEQLLKLNTYQLQLLLTKLITQDLKKSHESQQAINRIKSLLDLREDDLSLSEYYSNIFKSDESIKQFVKKID